MRLTLLTVLTVAAAHGLSTHGLSMHGSPMHGLRMHGLSMQSRAAGDGEAGLREELPPALTGDGPAKPSSSRRTRRRFFSAATAG